MTRTEKIALNKLNKKIEAIYYEKCHGVQINVMDIGKVFAAGRLAAAEGRDIECAVLAFVATVRKN